MKKIAYLSLFLFVSLVMARDLTKPPLKMSGVSVSTEARARAIASKAYVSKMNMGILSTEAVREIKIIKLGYTIKGFAEAGESLWETKVKTIDGAYRAIIWVNPNSEKVYFVNGPWVAKCCEEEK